MKEGSPLSITQINRFFESTQEAEAALKSLVGTHPNLSKAQAFQILAQGKGRGKSHASRFQQPQYQGEMKDS